MIFTGIRRVSSGVLESMGISRNSSSLNSNGSVKVRPTVSSQSSLPNREDCTLELPKGGTISKLQRWWKKKLEELGFLHLWVFDQQDIQVLEHLIRREVIR